MRATHAELLARRQATVLASLAELLDEPTYERALDGFVGALQARFGVERAVVALADGSGGLRLGAISQQALAAVDSAEVRLLIAAMEEACERERTVRFPESDERLGVLNAHRTLAGRRARTALVSVPLYHDTLLIGALLLERRDGDPFADSTCDLLERIALAAAPLIALRGEAASGALERLRKDVGAWIGRRLGPERPGRYLLLAGGFCALAATLLVPLERHIKADAELVPRERRLVTAPLSGFVEEVAVAAGERVAAGQLLARLDRRELDLEAARRDAEIASAEAGFRAAMAGHERQATAIARARLERERALRELVERRRERSELRAPIAGLIISGDPLDATGAPVSRGDTLFEIAPPEGYEVHLLVDETDIRDVHVGQRGALALRARPDDALELVVQRIHPVAESGDGASRFRVSASLAAPPPETLRPGEGGVARLDAGHESLAGRLLGPIGRRLAELRWRFLG